MSALRPSDLEEFTKRRRLVQDIDLDAYLVQKAQFIAFIDSIRKGTLALDSEEIQAKIGELKWKLETTNRRVHVSAQMDELKTKQLEAKMATYDEDMNEILRNVIIEKTEEYNNLLNQVKTTQKLLEQRQEVNAKVVKYIQSIGIISMTRKELTDLFTTEDINMEDLFRSGKLTKSSKEPALDNFEFRIESSAYLKRSSESLEKVIQEKITQCDEIKSKMEANKAQWIEIGTKLSSMLTGITDNVTF